MAQPNSPDAEHGLVLCLDVGGTKLEAGLVTSSGVIVERGRCATRGNATSEELWGDVCGLLDPLAKAGEAQLAIGVGCGGPMSVGGELVSPLNIPAWRDFPLRGRLAERYGLKAWLDNDAKALALAEGKWGGAKGMDSYLAMVVSTGIGGGLVVDGRLLDGFSGNAGHIGHVVVEPDGALCGCGARGCVEAEASGTGIERATGRPAKAADTETRRRTGRMVGRAAASAVSLLDLQGVFVAGSVALGYGDEFFEAAQVELSARARLDFATGVKIEAAGLGADGPLLGAAAVALARLGE